MSGVYQDHFAYRTRSYCSNSKKKSQKFKVTACMEPSIEEVRKLRLTLVEAIDENQLLRERLIELEALLAALNLKNHRKRLFAKFSQAMFNEAPAIKKTEVPTRRSQSC